ncbi:MAG: hypothetical protein DWQ02_15775 [Bacteroidetes bacterium]|nr:MAG: hypothetical protein DWQ02_15775 [Bacteroidota bacterium]
MKNLWLVLLSVVVFSLNSCTEDELTGGFVFGEIFDLEFGAEKTSDDGVLAVSFAEIQDSRCPLNVVCVWEGQAEVKLSVKVSGEEPVALELINRVGYPELGIDTLGNYIFTLEDVLPYPEDPEDLDNMDYVLKMKVEEL